MLKISPSVLACDFARLGQESKDMWNAGADMLHLDIMDGQFVPNLSFGPPVVSSLRKACPKAYFDVHLMIMDPLNYVEEFVRAGADLVVFHLESRSDPRKTIQAIKSCGARAGIALKPATPAQELFPYLEDLDMVLVMTVEPGFGGQSFMADMLPKVAAVRRRCRELGLDTDLEVDGGINFENAPLACSQGANVLVAGTLLFGAADYSAAVKKLRSCCG